MKAIVATTAAAIFTLSIASAAQAGNAGAGLGECYNHVISACNQTNHPIECSEGGMDACDELHASAQLGPIDRIKLLKMPGNQFRVILNPRTASYNGAEDGDNAGRGSRESRDTSGRTGR